MRASGACGSCQLATANKALDLEAKTLEPASPAEAFLCTCFPEERDRVRGDIEARRDRLSEQYPAASNWKAPMTSYFGQKPGEKSQGKPRRTSLLSVEVLPAEIHGEASWTGDSDFAAGWQPDGASAKGVSYGWDDWGAGYKTLSEELDEDKVSRADNGLPNPNRDRNDALDYEDSEDNTLLETTANQQIEPASGLDQTNAPVDDCIADTADDMITNKHTDAPQALAPVPSSRTTISKSTDNTVAGIPPLTPCSNTTARPVPTLRTPPAQACNAVSKTSHFANHNTACVEGQASQAFAPPTSESLLAMSTGENVKIRMGRRQQSRSGREDARVQLSSGRGRWVEDLTSCLEWVRLSS